MTRTLMVTLATIALTFAAIACDDDDDPAPATPAQPTAAASTVASATAAPAPTLDPSITPRPAATLELSAEPQQLTCDGEQPSVVTARVLDEDGQPVPDGTAVRFDVATFATADPIMAVTAGGEAQTTVVALGQQVGVVVNVTSGDAAMSIRVDCL